MADRNFRHSPLEGFSSGGAVAMSEVPFLAQINLRLDPAGPAAAAVGKDLGVALPRRGGTSATSGDVSVLWLGPDEWLVVGPPGAETRLTALLESAAGAAHASVVDVSAQRTAVALRGPRVRELLALGCSLDLHPRVFGVGDCAQTMLAHAPVVVWRRESEFWILVRASFAGHLAAWLEDAGIEFTVRD
ncbi:sarcosine oxidase subunit gamma family protein [Actinoplanes sp. NEAU-A12]|uniref:Sarcosine oxidase subunit gamma family protein n=1 Tax=Actinoplanes sandaracinus TaxID=3045177 RepID=A0ABT6WBI0_9ACTN|nr:sarcosine oxidase subunit gamma family protein [Actinoplanes sandaracinus]MDI6097059.1 sarcosine oxidase subunit gamma family protein [Actinoplanes sandaracinus]